MDLASIGFKADTSGIDKASRGLDSLAKQGDKTDRALGGASSSIGKAFAGIAVAVGGLASATSALQKLVSVSREFDVLNAGLITATGSAQKASQAFKAIQDFATTTPYSLAQATKAFTQLVNLGLTPSEAALTSYGNTAAAMGKDLSQMVEAVADATVGEFERLKEFGIKASSEGDRVSFTFRGMTTTVKKSADEIESYLMRLGENQFAGAMANRMNTLDGAISNLSDSWDALFLNISQKGAGGVIEASVRGATDAIVGLTSAIASGQIGDYIDAILGKFSGFGFAIESILNAVGDMFTDAGKFWYLDMAKSADLIIDAFVSLPENIKAFLQIATVEVAAYVDRMVIYGKMAANALNPLTQVYDPTADFAKTNQARAATIQKIMDERQASIDLFKTQIDGADKVRVAFDGKSASLKGVKDRLAQYKAGVDKSTASTGATSTAIAILNDEMDEFTESAIFLNDNESWRAFDHADLIQEMQDELDGLNGKIEQTATISEKAAERIEEAFADAWLNAFDGFESVVDGMKNAFKRMLAEMAHMALTKPIMVSMGLGGLLPGTASAGGFGGIESLFGGASSSMALGLGISALAGGAIGGSAGGKGAIGGSIGAIGGMALAGPIGAAIGAALGGAVGSLFGGKWETNKSSLGLSFSGGDVSGTVTTEEKKKKLWKNRYRTSTSDFDTSAIDDAFDSISAALGQAANAFGITGADEVIKGFAASANINIKDKTEEEVQAAIQEWIGATTGALVNAVFGDSLDGLQKEGEGVIDTVSRLTANMGAVQSISKTLGLGFDLTGKAAMIASTNIVELAGGLDQLSALTSQYYSAFYSEAEQQQNLATQLASSFEALNVTMPMTREGFRSIVDSLDLTTESGQQMFAALMQLVPGMDQYLTALEAQRTASEQAAEAAQKEAEAKAAALKSQGLDLQLRLYDAIGQSSQALAMRRQMELEATDETLRALLMQIYAAEDAAAAQRELTAAQEAATRLLQQRQDLEIELLDATGNSAQATAMRRQLELAAMDESLRGLQQSIWTAQDAAAAQEALAQAQADAASAAKDLAQNAFGKLQDAAGREKDRLQTELDAKMSALQIERDELEKQRGSVIAGYQEQGQAVQEYISKLEGLNSVINGFLSDTGAAVDPFKRLGQIFNEVKVGLLPDQNELSSVLSGIQSAGSGGFGSGSDAAFAMAVARNQAAGIGSTISGRLNGARGQMAGIEAAIVSTNAYYDQQLLKLDAAAELAQKQHDEQVSLIDKQLSDAEKQLNALLGVDDRILTMTEALAEFYAALNSPASAQVVASNSVASAVEVAAIEQVEAIDRVEAAIVQLGVQLVEMNKPLDRVWVPPTMPDRYKADGELSAEMLALLKELVAGNEAIAKHTKTSADALELNQFENAEAKP